MGQEQPPPDPSASASARSGRAQPEGRDAASWGDSARLPDPGYELLPPVERGPNLPKTPAPPRARPRTRRLQASAQGATGRIARRRTSRRQRRASARLKHSTGSGLLPYGSSAAVHPERSRSSSSQRHVASRPMPAAILAVLPLLLLVAGGLVLLNGSQPTRKRAPRETTAPAIRAPAAEPRQRREGPVRSEQPPGEARASAAREQPALPPTPARAGAIEDEAEVSPSEERARLEAWAERERELQRREASWLKDLREEQAEGRSGEGEASSPAQPAGEESEPSPE